MTHSRLVAGLLLTAATASPAPSTLSADDIFKTAVAVWHMADRKSVV